MGVKETLGEIVDDWFMYEPLLFNVYCTHKLTENENIAVPIRVGKRRIEYNPLILQNFEKDKVEKLLRIEIIRILLKHPYERVPRNPKLTALTKASDITISENCGKYESLTDAAHYNLATDLSFEEYYQKLYYICPEVTPSSEDSGDEQSKPSYKMDYKQASDASELWEEDEEISDSINNQILKAQKNNQWGSIGGDIQSSILASLKIPMDYRRILSQFRASIISQKRKLTRMKPNRRYGFDFMGSQYEPKTKLLVAVDVSGSIGNDDLSHFFSIINRFFSYGVKEIKVISFDVKITQEYELKKARKKVLITGRGGTDFQPVINYYEQHSEYQGLILFTDGYSDVPKITKGKQMVWVLTSKNDYERANRWIKGLKGSKATWIPSVATA